MADVSWCQSSARLDGFINFKCNKEFLIIAYKYDLTIVNGCQTGPNVPENFSGYHETTEDLPEDVIYIDDQPDSEYTIKLPISIVSLKVCGKPCCLPLFQEGKWSKFGGVVFDMATKKQITTQGGLIDEKIRNSLKDYKKLFLPKISGEVGSAIPEALNSIMDGILKSVDIDGNFGNDTGDYVPKFGPGETENIKPPVPYHPEFRINETITSLKEIIAKSILLVSDSFDRSLICSPSEQTQSTVNTYGNFPCDSKVIQLLGLECNPNLASVVTNPDPSIVKPRDDKYSFLDSYVEKDVNQGNNDLVLNHLISVENNILLSNKIKESYVY